jgi:putative membrane protein
VRPTRMSRAWSAMIFFAFVLIVLLIFILQNGQRVKVSFVGSHGHLPLAVAMLFAAIAGALLVAIPGIGRMIQLRRVVRRNADISPPAQPVPAAPAVPVMPTTPAVPGTPPAPPPPAPATSATPSAPATGVRTWRFRKNVDRGRPRV